MVDRKLRLVHSTESRDGADKGRTRWGFENARQLGLFEDLDAIHAFLIPVAEVSKHSFSRELTKRGPRLIIDTRRFPDFYSVFASTERALIEFRNRGIEYSRVPLCGAKPPGGDWSHWADLKSILGKYLEKRTGAPVFVLTSTRKSSVDLANKLEGYLSQEVGQTKLEEMRE